MTLIQKSLPKVEEIKVGKLVLISAKPSEKIFALYNIVIAITGDLHEPTKWEKQLITLKSNLGMVYKKQYVKHPYFDNGLFKILIYSVLVKDKLYNFSTEDIVIKEYAL